MNPDFRELLRALSDADARFLVVGAYAVSYHAEPRAAADLDIWLTRRPRTRSACTGRSGPLAPRLPNCPRLISRPPESSSKIGVAPRRIDILTSIDGVAFADAWPGRAEASYEGVRFPVIGIDALMKHKPAVGRPKDLLDLELLGRYRRPLP